jgi:hypothetical protein
MRRPLRPTSLDINAKILELVEAGGKIGLLCLVTPHATPRDVGRAERALISAAHPPWNRQGNPRPRPIEDAIQLRDLLGFAGGMPQRVSLPT